MNLQEPKKKKRPKVQEQPPFPIDLGDKNEWTTYTAHLTDVGSCIIDPDEITAVHSMGFFGKGSLSRGFPSFCKARYGAPPIIRNRQWIRRQEWMKQFNELSVETSGGKDKNSLNNIPQSENLDEDDIECLNNPEDTNTPSVIEIDVNSSPEDKETQRKQGSCQEEKDTNLISKSGNDAVIDIDKDINESSNNTDNNQECIESSRKESYCIMDFKFKENDAYIIDSNPDIEDKLLVLPDSDSETENYLKEVTPRIECESFPVQETLHLTFEETFFLLYGLGCLNLIDFDGNLLDIDSAWQLFSKSDKNFIPKYVVYHYFRSKGWVVKPGLKYGGDFLLYKKGPPFYHASYIVIIDILDGDTLIRDQSKNMHKLTWNNLFGLERLSETAAKEILFAQILWPSSAQQATETLNVDILAEFSVRELLWRRWNPKHNKDVEEEEDDSN